MTMPGTPFLSVRHFNCTGRTRRPPRQFGPNHTEKRRQMGPGGCLSHFDNAPQDGDSAGVAERIAGATQHPMPDLTTSPPPMFTVSNC